MSAVAGPSVDVEDVEQAVEKTIDYWISYYLSVKELAKGLADQTIARPRSYNATFDYLNWPEGQLPGVAIICPGSADQPIRRGSGDVATWFEVNVDLIVADATEALTRHVAVLYQSAIQLLMMQQATLAGGTDTAFSEDVVLTDFKIELPDGSNRTLVVATNTFHVLVDSILNTMDGPDTVPSDPGAQWPVVETPPTISLTTVPIDQPLD